tara:strand:+ start:306 stop:1673 length:1368 start_codon:yes stop_codon:yes gene_type:complete
MLKKSTLFAAGFAALIGGASLALAQGTPQDVPEAAESETVMLGLDRIDNYLSEKGWSQGPNKDGKIMVSAGIGVIKARPGSKQYLGARNNAYKQALLQAKQEMVNYLGQEISRQIEMTYSEPEIVAETQSEAEAMEESGPGDMGLLEKSELLIHSELDNLLQSRGVDLSTEEGVEKAQEEVKTLLAETKFKDSIQSMARNEVAGLTAYKSFECQPADSQGEIAVICVYTEKTRMMAAALLGRGEAPPKKKGKKKLKDQLPGDESIAHSFGVQQRIDENGDIVLISFGHGVPRTKSRMAMNAATQKAQLNADGDIRSFAGEMIATASTLDTAESYQEFEDEAGNASDVYESMDSFEQTTKAQAAALKISGITTLYRAEVTHPVTGEKFMVVVRQWSPAASDQASVLSDRLNAMKGSKGGSGRKAPGSKKDQASKDSGGPTGSGSGEGADGDDDAID